MALVMFGQNTSISLNGLTHRGDKAGALQVVASTPHAFPQLGYTGS
jgi:hypothetical protein